VLTLSQAADYFKVVFTRATLCYRRVSVCLSVCHKPVCIEITERIKMVYGTEASFDLFYIVLEKNSGIS